MQNCTSCLHSWADEIRVTTTSTAGLLLCVFVWCGVFFVQKPNQNCQSCSSLTHALSWQLSPLRSGGDFAVVGFEIQSPTGTDGSFTNTNALGVGNQGDSMSGSSDADDEEYSNQQTDSNWQGADGPARPEEGGGGNSNGGSAADSRRSTRRNRRPARRSRGSSSSSVTSASTSASALHQGTPPVAEADVAAAEAAAAAASAAAATRPRKSSKSRRRKKKFKLNYNGCLQLPPGEVHPAIINALYQLDDLVTNASIKCTVRQASVQQRTDRRLRVHAPNRIVLRAVEQKDMPPKTEVRIEHQAVTVVSTLWLPVKLLAQVRAVGRRRCWESIVFVTRPKRAGFPHD